MITGGNLTSQPPWNQCITQKIMHNEIKENSEKRKKLTTQHSYSHSEILTTVWNLKCLRGCNCDRCTFQYFCVIQNVRQFYHFPKKVHIKPASTPTRRLVSSKQHGSGRVLEAEVDK